MKRGRRSKNARHREDACADFLATTATLALVVATPAFAQTSNRPDSAETAAAPQDAPEAETRRQDDIIVTARRREESIRDVPGTINGGDRRPARRQGPDRGQRRSAQHQRPVSASTTWQARTLPKSRSADRVRHAPRALILGVGLFVNGAYVGSSTLGGRNFKTLDYFDIERVEALQGPQGALYGRNPEFGVVNIVLAKPKFESSLGARDVPPSGSTRSALPR